jgi:geranylgeranyl transferase type-2 subunit alpha
MFDKTYNQEAFSLTTRIVNWNPEFYTIWNYRRDILLNFVLQPGQEEENQKVFKEELLLFMQLIRMNPKSYWLWNHRFWCLQNMPKPDWNAELGLVDKMLSMDARNCKQKRIRKQWHTKMF